MFIFVVVKIVTILRGDDVSVVLHMIALFIFVTIKIVTFLRDEGVSVMLHLTAMFMFVIVSFVNINVYMYVCMYVYNSVGCKTDENHACASQHLKLACMYTC
jgi:hypothetical protein